MRVVFRIVGWLLLLMATAIGVYEFVELLTGDHKPLYMLGELWFKLSNSSLNVVQAFVQRYLFPELWDYAIRPLLVQVPALAFVLGLAIIFLILARIGRSDDSTASRRMRRRRTNRLN